MCGIAGFLTRHQIGERGSAICIAMGDALSHRGPDSFGNWLDAERGIYFAHRRLSIIDLSAAGHQPMVSVTGRFIVSYNGEIYNHNELRESIASQFPEIQWRGHSDTETLATAIEIWGIERAISLCEGMFAIAIWDRDQEKLTLVRDRFGEKPLYCGWQNGTFLFSSELKALKTHPDFEAALDHNAIALQLQYNCIPAPFSIYSGIYKLPPGSMATVSRTTERVEISQYWTPQKALQFSNREQRPNDIEVVSEFEKLFRQAVSRQMLSDVSLGALLSGGLDSTLVVAQMQELSDKPVNTFTIGFSEAGFDESVYARKLSEHLGTAHNELIVTPQDALDVIPQLPSIYDEPFSDSSQIPAFLISKLAREKVTVALSGDGADELFGGYNRYTVAERWWPGLNRIPGFFRGGAAALISAVPANAYSQMGRAAARFDSHQYRWGNLAYRAGKIAQVLDASDIEDYHAVLTAHWTNPSSVVIGADELSPQSSFATGAGCDPSDIGLSLMLKDMSSYLPDDILVKVDRAAMAVSLETRAPYLDRKLAEFAIGLPTEFKIRNGKGKWVMRELLSKKVPTALTERPKMGFALPMGTWLRGPLREWCEALLDETRLAQEGIFDPGPIRQKWDEHLSGKADWQYLLWDVLMFQAWKEQN